MARKNVNVGSIRGNRGKVNIAGRDVHQTFNTMIQRALTAAEEAARARQLESKLLAQGVGALVRNLSMLAGEGFASDIPYKGLLSYGLNEAEIFYGRSEAQKELLNCLRQSPLTVLHAEIGAGKSSLLQAGIAAQLIASGHLAIHLRPYDAEPVDFIKRMFLPELSQAPALAQISLREFLRQVGAVLGAKINLYLFLDQFEEFFHLLKKDERQHFLESLADCLNDPSLRVRWVLALRAEALSDLAELESFGIAPFKNTYRLNRLRRSEAREAISEPAHRFRIEFEPDLLDHILDTLASQDEVMPTHLQLVCSALTDDLPDDKTLTLAYYTEHEGGTEGILRDYLKRQLEHLPVSEQGLAWRVLRALITSDGQRAVKSYEDLVQEFRSSGVSKKQIDMILTRLVERRLLFSQPTTAETFELAHDYLIKEIEIDPQEQARKAAQELLDQETRSFKRHGTLLSAERLAVIEPHQHELRFSEDAMTLLLESQKVARQEQLARERRRRTILATSFGIAIVMSLLALWAWRSSEMAAQQAKISRAGELAALALSEENSHLDAALLFGVEGLRTDDSARTEGALLTLTDSHRGLSDFLTGHVTGVLGTAFSPDGKWLASSSEDGTILLWDVTKPENPLQRATLSADDGAVSSIAFSPFLADGTKLLAAGTSASTVLLWDVSDLSDPVLISTLAEHTSGLLSVAFSPDGETLAAGAEDGTILLWDISNPAAVAQPISLTEHEDAVNKVVFSPDGQTFASGSSDGTIILWDIRTTTQPSRRIQWSADQDIISSVTFSTDGTLLVSGGEDPAIKLWDITDPDEPVQIAMRSGHYGPVYSTAFSPDGKYMASAGWDRTVILWDVSLPEDPSVQIWLTGHNSPVNSLAFSPDSKTLASGSYDETVILWDILHLTAPSEIAQLSEHSDFVSSIAYSPDGTQLASGGLDHNTLLWDVTNLGADSTPITLNRHSDAVSRVAFSPDGKRLASGSWDNTVLLWDISDPGAPSQPVTLSEHASPVYSVAFSPLDNRKLLASGHEDGTLLLWNVDELNTPVLLTTLAEHTNIVSSLVFSPDGKYLASGSWDNKIILWDIGNPGALIQAGVITSDSLILSLAFSPDGKTLASGHGDATVRLWDITDPDSSTPLATLQGHSEPVFSVAFRPDGKRLASGGQDARIILWDVSDPGSPLRLAELTGHSHYVQSVTFSPDGKQLASGSWDTTIILWDLDPESWEKKACQRAGRNFTQSEWAQYFPNEEYRITCPQWPAGK